MPLFNSTHMSHTVPGRVDVETRCQTETTASLGVSHLSRELEAGSPPESLALPVGYRP